VSKVFFSVGDIATATYASDTIGDATIMVESSGASGGTSHQFSQGMQSQTSKGDSYNWSRNVQPQARKVLKPEEIIQLDERLAITFAPNVPPVLTRLVRWYEEPNMGKGSGWILRAFAACATLVMSLMVFGGALLVAAAITDEANRMSRYDYPPQIYQQQWPQPRRIPYGRRTNY
jgi:type IV secretion system protein VirD4